MNNTNYTITSSKETSLPKIIYLGRDTIFHGAVGCSKKEEAEKYINKFSGIGYIEIFELLGDYYYFKDAEWVGKVDRNSPYSKGFPFGKDLLNQGIHKNYINIILNFKG